MNGTKTLREKVIESAVIIGAILIFAGFLKQNWFYSHFGIPIHQYLSLDEILILFFSDLAFITKIALSAVIYSYFLKVLIKIFNLIFGKKLAQVAQVREQKDVFDAVVDKGLRNSFGLFLALILSLVMTIVGYNWFERSNSLISIIYLALLSSQTVLLFFKWVNDRAESEFILTFVLIVGLMTPLFLKNTLDIKETESQYERVVYTITMKDKVIQTSGNLLFLGKSKDYIYLYNKTNSKAMIYRTEEVEMYELKK